MPGESSHVLIFESGEPVQALFRTLKAGYSLATTMHTPDVNDVFHQICAENDISDADASVIEYVIHCQLFGEDDESYWRRVDRVDEVTGVENGVPIARELFSWNEDNDSFTALSAPTGLNASPDLLAERAKTIRRQVAESAG